MVWPSTDLNRTGKQFLIKICSSRTRYHQHPITTDTSDCFKHILTFKRQLTAASIASFLIQKLDCHLPLSPGFICIDNTLLWINTTFPFHLGTLSCREAFKLVYFLCNKAEMWHGRKGRVLLPHSLCFWHFRQSNSTYFRFNRGSHLYQSLDGFYQALVSQKQLLDLRGVRWLAVLQFMQHSIMSQNSTVQCCQTLTSEKKNQHHY